MNQLIDGGFELGTGWITSVNAVRDNARAHLGSWSMRIGGCTDCAEYAYQEVTIPEGVARANLSYWFYMTTDAANHPWDFLYVEVRDTSDTLLEEVQRHSDGDVEGQWLHSTDLDLTPWVGQTVRIYFYATNTSVAPTTFWIDGVGLETCPPEPTVPDFRLTASPSSLDTCQGTDAVYIVDVDSILGFSDPVDLSLSGVPAGAAPSFSVDPVTPPDSSVLAIDTAGVTASGLYTIEIAGTSGVTVHEDIVTLNVDLAVPGRPVLSAPANGVTGQPLTPTLMWSPVSGADDYTLHVSTSPGFSSFDSYTLSGTSYTLSTALSPDAVYYWRVRSSNAGCGGGVWSVTRAFRTQAITECNDLILNGGFELGRNGDWAESYIKGPIINQWTVVAPRTGTWYALLGGYMLADDIISQTVTIPAGATGSLTYWYYTLSGDNKCTGDFWGLRINDLAVEEHVVCNTNDTGGTYLLNTIDMSGYAGGNASIEFWTTNDNDNASSGKHSILGIDDVTLNLCTPANPVSADYSDLDSEYGVAWHTGDGALRLGSAWTVDDDFGPGSDNSDQTNGSDDGVSFPDGFRAGTTANVQVNVQGTSANGRWLRLWFDWNRDGAFDDDELVYNDAAVNGDNAIAVTVPSTATTSINYRVRLYDSAGAPAGLRARDTGTYGGADGGEVEDGSSPLPTAVVMAGLDARPERDAIRVTWETGSELELVGFDLYRGRSAGGPYTRLNGAPIVAQYPGMPLGASYAWLDADVQPGETYFYLVEGWDVYGERASLGPVSAMAQRLLFLPLVLRR
ncbi:MAG: fibronectin type III domain-containing protein [Anaerolineae bacterium]|nr:fibronectin type III domain-containing protein [Anaerolineae bacterium]